MRSLRRAWIWILLGASLLIQAAWPGGWAGLGAAPLLKPLTQAGLRVTETISAYSGWTSAREIARLRERVSQLESETREQDRLRGENERLRRLLGLRSARFAQAAVASVCGRGPADWATHVLLDRGRRDAISTDSVAICEEGLVGRVTEVDEKSSRVRFLTAPGSVVPAVLAKAGVVGLLYGQGARSCELRFVEATARVEVGDLVYTSGQGQTYPAGLCLGKVIRNQGRAEALYQTLDVVPITDFSRLREVLLVTRPGPELAPPHVLDLDGESRR